ncbi:MAG: hypothetical protein ACREEC_09395 [Thermoplasmata archaeon]
MDQLASAPCATRQARLHLQPMTLARLMRWQTQAVEGGGIKPTYSALIDALVARYGDLEVGDLLPPLQKAG